VSPGQLLANGDLAAELAGTDRAIVLEITEHERIADYRSVTEHVRRLPVSPQLSVDDTGSGFASLRHVLELAPRFIKLDQAWIRGINGDPSRQALISGLVHFANRTSADLVAEGIEEPAELETVRTLGVSYAQGFLLGRPQEA